MYYELLRAKYSGNDSDSDPFPGTGGVTELNNFTTPSLLTWNNMFNDYAISGITERNRNITFDVELDNSILSIIEDFEDVPISTNMNAKNVKGAYCKWDFAKCAVVETEEEQGKGHRAVGMKKPSQLTSSAPLNIIPYMVEFTVYNPPAPLPRSVSTTRWTADKPGRHIPTENSTPMPNPRQKYR